MGLCLVWRISYSAYVKIGMKQGVPRFHAKSAGAGTQLLLTTFFSVVLKITYMKCSLDYFQVEMGQLHNPSHNRVEPGIRAMGPGPGSLEPSWDEAGPVPALLKEPAIHPPIPTLIGI